MFYIIADLFYTIIAGLFSTILRRDGAERGGARGPPAMWGLCRCLPRSRPRGSVACMDTFFLSTHTHTTLT